MDAYARLIRAFSKGETPKIDFTGKVISLNPLTVDIGVINVMPGYVNADLELELNDTVLVLSDTDYTRFSVICKLREV